jgi:hypothetical protein
MICYIKKGTVLNQGNSTTEQKATDMNDILTSIKVGAEADQEVAASIPLITLISTALNESVALTQYGEALEEFRFIIVIMKPLNTLHPDEHKFSTRYRRLTIWRNINFEQALAADENTFLQMVAAKMLDTIAEFPSFGIRNFDNERFQKDVEKIFVAKGWI